VAKIGRWVAKIGRWVAKLVARLLATAALWVRIQTSLMNTKWATSANLSGQLVARQKIYRKTVNLRQTGKKE